MVAVVVGIDVAKAHVDVWVLGTKLDVQRFDNEAEAHSALAAALKPLDVALVVTMAPDAGHVRAEWCQCGRSGPDAPLARGHREQPARRWRCPGRPLDAHRR